MRIAGDRQVWDHRRRAKARVGDAIASLYGAFVAWGSVYEDDGTEQDARRARVAQLLGELSTGYLPQSVWTEKAGRKKVEGFIAKAEDLYATFFEEVGERGYPRVRSEMAHRVSKELGPLKREAEANLGIEAPDSRRSRRNRSSRALSRSR